MFIKRLNVVRALAVLSAALLTHAVHAAEASSGPDLAVITGAGTTVAAVGAAVFGVAVGIKLYKWIRAAL